MQNLQQQPPAQHFNLRLIAGTANPQLAAAVSSALGQPLERCNIGKFADGEISISIEEPIRGGDVYVLQPCAYPDVNGQLVELLLLLQTLRLASAARVVAVLPHFPYARQDQKTRPRVPLAAACVAELLETMGAHRVLALDLHSDQIAGFFPNAIVDHLSMPVAAELAAHLRASYAQLLADASALVVVAPDAAGVPRARTFADLLAAPAVASILPRGGAAAAEQRASYHSPSAGHRIGPSELVLTGAVEGRVALVVDDMVDTGARVLAATRLLHANGAAHVLAVATHGLLSGDAAERLNAEPALLGLVVTDSIAQDDHLRRCKKLQVCSIARLLAEAIRRTHADQSLSALQSARGRRPTNPMLPVP